MKPDWQSSRRVEESYYADIMRIMREALSGKIPLIGIQEFLDRWAEQAARRMVLGRAVSNARTWRGAARESMRGAMVYELLQRELSGPVGARVQELIRKNAELIRLLPVKVREQAAARQARLAFEGGRSTLAPEATSHLARWHARLIARTETSKATTALTQARSEELDLPWYVWRTSEDERVRHSHRKMANVLFRWDDPPPPEKLAGIKSTLGRYTAGNAPNCRCYPEPLLTLLQVSWPNKVYYGGVIRSTTLAEFRRINYLPKHVERIGIAA